MALKLPDSAVPMGDFPVAKAVDIDFNDGENLQEKLDNGKLGGAGGGNVYANTPIGTVLSFAGQTPPNGYLLCDGRSYVVTDYQDLYDVIGNTYGGNAENFNVPNLIDKFIQGSNTSGTEMSAGLPNITGGFAPGSVPPNHINYATGAFYGSVITEDKVIGEIKATNRGYGYNFSASRSNSIYGNSDTVQPPALTMVYIIKAFHTNEGVDSSVELEDNVINHIDTRIENKVNEQVTNEVVKKTDIVTTIDSSSADDEVPSAKAVYDELQDLFQSVSDGKTLVANAITDKGVSTATDATFATMATNISRINTNGYKEETVSYNKTSTGTNRIIVTFSADVYGIKQITPPSDASSNIVPETTTSMFTVNGRKLTLYVNGVGTWKVTAMVRNA